MILPTEMWLMVSCVIQVKNLVLFMNNLFSLTVRPHTRIKDICANMWPCDHIHASIKDFCAIMWPCDHIQHQGLLCKHVTVRPHTRIKDICAKMQPCVHIHASRTFVLKCNPRIKNICAKMQPCDHIHASRLSFISSWEEEQKCLLHYQELRWHSQPVNLGYLPVILHTVNCFHVCM
jgi:hypothetical protein